MAAKENQGLQIALIAFVMLTILLSVATYLLFSNWKESDKKMVAAQTEAREASTKKDAADKDVADLKLIIGAPTDSVETIKANMIKMVNEQYVPLGMAAFPDTDKNYTKILSGLADTIKAKYTDIESVNKKLADLKSTTDKATAELNSRLTQAQGALDAANAELIKEKDNYKLAVDALKTEKDQLVQDKGDIHKQMDDLKTANDHKLTDLNAQLKKASDEVKVVKDELKKYYHIDPSTTGAYVTWIGQRENMAYINLGWEDGLHRRITFSVYPPGTTDVAKATAKGKIEVINVTGPHLAEARIIDNPTNNPLVPGDIIHTQGWHPGQHEHFGIAGLIDIDGNGVDQTRKLKDLILANGGFVDAEIAEGKNGEGTMTLQPKGEMTVNTRYLIMGDLDKPAASNRLTPSATLMKEADRLNIERVGLQKFLAMMGYSPRSAAAGGAAAPADAAAAPGADDNGFRSRKPPARGKDDSAF